MKNCLILFFFCFASAGFSQNLVPNPSFEDTVMCPESIGQIFRAEYWDSYRETPDYYNVCSDTLSSVPYNGCGFQFPATGVAYAGIQTYFNNNYREYLGIQLGEDKTEIGQKYYFSVKLNLAKGGQAGANCSSNNFGMKLSTIPYSFNNPAPIDNYSIFHLNYPILDTANWVLITDSFMADSEYSYLFMGNFYDYDYTDTTILGIYTPTYCRSIYFIDDVCLSKTIDGCDFSNSAITLTKSNIKIFPNPAKDVLFLESPFEINCKIFNQVGKQTDFGQLNAIVHKMNGGYSTTINLETAPAGVYYLETRTYNNISNFKIIKL